MKQKLRLTITRIRRQTTLSGGIGHREACPQIIRVTDEPAPAQPIASFDFENPVVTNPIADRHIREINAPANTMPNDYENLKIIKDGKN